MGFGYGFGLKFQNHLLEQGPVKEKERPLPGTQEVGAHRLDQNMPFYERACYKKGPLPGTQFWEHIGCIFPTMFPPFLTVSICFEITCY